MNLEYYNTVAPGGTTGFGLSFFPRPTASPPCRRRRDLYPRPCRPCQFFGILPVLGRFGFSEEVKLQLGREVAAFLFPAILTERGREWDGRRGGGPMEQFPRPASPFFFLYTHGERWGWFHGSTPSSITPFSPPEFPFGTALPILVVDHGT